MDERRQHPRYPLHKEVQVRMPDEQRITAWTVDVSHGGCRLRLPRPAAVGAPLHVEMPVSGGMTLSTLGRVRHLSSVGNAILVGVQWVSR
jgi:hypothetical protein